MLGVWVAPVAKLEWAPYFPSMAMPLVLGMSSGGASQQLVVAAEGTTTEAAAAALALADSPHPQAALNAAWLLLGLAL